MNMELHSTKLLDRVKEAIRYKHYSLRTEEVNLYWCRYFIRFHQLRHPKEMGHFKYDCGQQNQICRNAETSPPEGQECREIIR